MRISVRWALGIAMAGTFLCAGPVPAAGVDLSVYQDKPLESCPNHFPCSRLSRWECMSRACATPGDQEPTRCYDQFAGDKMKANITICWAYSWPTPENIQSVVDVIPGAAADDVAQGLMMMLAVRGNGAGCREGLKDYVGPYGPAWTPFWVGAMSGCRILANERSVRDEEGDYKIWAAAKEGQLPCADMRNADMQAMCEAGVYP